MTTYVGADEAALLLGVTKPTLYAYVSRGLVARRTAIDGRTSLYDREQLEALTRRSPRRRQPDRPSIDVRIGSAVTVLDENGPRYRGHRIADLARSHPFESVAELLWTGSLPPAPPVWRLDPDDARAGVAAVASIRPADPIVALEMCGCALVSRVGDDEPATAGRRLLALAPTVFGGPRRGSIAERLARAWTRSPSPELVAAIDRALVLLADHELATSTLAVRVAASVRTDPMSAVVAGLATVRGPLHGTASRATAALLDDAAADGAEVTIRRWLDTHGQLPGFGHGVYHSADPRVTPLLDAVRALPDRVAAMATVDSVVAEAGRLVGQPPNVDLAVGALVHVADLPRDAPLFAVARIAGWIAHYVEELGERPLRFRGLATRVEG